jgi:CBS domain-containing protein
MSQRRGADRPACVSGGRGALRWHGHLRILDLRAGEEIEMTGATRVRDLMEQQVATLNRNDKLTIADDVMRLGRIRHLPILDDDGESVIGVVSQRDLFRGALARALGYGEHAQQKLLNQLLVKEVMTNDPVTIGPEAAIEEAAALMVERKIGCLIVVEDGRLAGILTESDFVKAFAQPGRG